MEAMSNALKQLITQWQASTMQNSPYLFDGDGSVHGSPRWGKHFVEYPSLNGCVKNGGLDEAPKGKLHVGILPQPYFGRLDTAKVVLLMANPGLSFSDYLGETDQKHKQEYSQALKDNLCQQRLGKDYPFLFLDPKFAWHSGYHYWMDKFRPIVMHLMQCGHDYGDACKLLAQCLAVLQLVPYHSKSMPGDWLFDNLPSARATKAYAQSLLGGKPNGSCVLVVLMRRKKSWELPKVSNSENCLLDASHNNRGAHLSDDVAKKIAEWLLNRPCA
jgi:hypothetical protein